MKIKLLMGAAAAAIAAAAASGASAQTYPVLHGPYIAADVGVNLPEDVSASSNLIVQTTQSQQVWKWRPDCAPRAVSAGISMISLNRPKAAPCWLLAT